MRVADNLTALPFSIERIPMKRKLLGIVIVTALMFGKCAPEAECTPLNPNPALCKGTKGPVAVYRVNNQPRIMYSK